MSSRLTIFVKSLRSEVIQKKNYTLGKKKEKKF